MMMKARNSCGRNRIDKRAATRGGKAKKKKKRYFSRLRYFGFGNSLQVLHIRRKKKRVAAAAQTKKKRGLFFLTNRPR